MSPEQVVRTREHYIGAFEVREEDPGPVDPKETRNWSERFTDIVDKVKLHLPEGKRITPAVTILPAEDNRPEVTLSLALEPIGGVSLVIAYWRYNLSPEQTRWLLDNKRFSSANEMDRMEEESFDARWLRNEHSGDTSQRRLNVTLNHLEHSVVAYETAFSRQFPAPASAEQT